jgi:hypothetical protein
MSDRKVHVSRLSRPRLFLGTLAFVVSSIVAAGCGATAPVSHAPKSTATASHDRFTTTLTVSRTAVSAGTPIPSILVIINHTGRAVSFFSCLGDASLEVGIGSARVPFNPLSGAIGCFTRLEPGRNVFRESILTDYLGCGGSGVPPCGSPPIIDPLPVGTYQTSIDWEQVPHVVPHPAPLTIMLTPSREGILQGVAYPCGMSWTAPSVVIRQGARLVEQLAEFGNHYRDRLPPGRYTVSRSPRGAIDRTWTVMVRPDRTTTAPTIEDTCK